MALKPLLPRKIFLKRLLLSVCAGIGIIFASLFLGMLGYHTFEKLPWVDAFVNAAMILSGMGPVSTLNTDAGKIFAGCYALYSGIALISIVGIIFAPVVRRFLHKYHLEFDDDEKTGKTEKKPH